MIWRDDDWEWEHVDSLVLNPGETVKVGMGLFFPGIRPKGDSCLPSYSGTSCDIRLRLETNPGALYVVAPQSADSHDISQGQYTITPPEVVSVIGRR